jgi:hypothetical protein
MIFAWFRPKARPIVMRMPRASRTRRPRIRLPIVACIADHSVNASGNIRWIGKTALDRLFKAKEETEDAKHAESDGQCVDAKGKKTASKAGQAHGLGLDFSRISDRWWRVWSSSHRLTPRFLM